MLKIDPTYAALLHKEATWLMNYIEGMNDGIVHIWIDKTSPLRDNKALEQVQDELLNAYDFLKKVRCLTSNSKCVTKRELI